MYFMCMFVHIGHNSIGHSNFHVGDFKPSFKLVKKKRAVYYRVIVSYIND